MGTPPQMRRGGAAGDGVVRNRKCGKPRRRLPGGVTAPIIAVSALGEGTRPVRTRCLLCAASRGGTLGPP